MVGELSHSPDPWTPDRVLYAPAPPGWLLPRLQDSPWVGKALGLGQVLEEVRGRVQEPPPPPHSSRGDQTTGRGASLLCLSLPRPGIPAHYLVKDVTSPLSYPSAWSAFPDCPVRFSKPVSRSLLCAGHFSLLGDRRLGMSGCRAP